MTAPADAEPAFIDYLKREGLWETIDADRYARLWGAFTEGRTVSEREIRARVAADLRRAADGRREYARTAVKDDTERDLMAMSARAYESAAGVAESPLNVLDLIPVHWWTAEEHAAVEPTDAGKPPVLNVTRDRHCGHCGRDNAAASVYETPLCHTDDPGLPDCYRRVTVYSEPVGALLAMEPLPAGVQGIARNVRPRA